MGPPPGTGRDPVSDSEAVMGRGDHLAHRKAVDHFADLRAGFVAVARQTISHSSIDGHEPIGDEHLAGFEVIKQDLSKLDTKLSNAGFTDKAPAEVVAKERERLAAQRQALAQLQEQQQRIATL